MTDELVNELLSQVSILQSEKDSQEAAMTRLTQENQEK